MAAHFCSALVCPQKATLRIQFLPNFWAGSKHFGPAQNILGPVKGQGISLPSKSHGENSISSKFLESPHQVDMKNIVKSSKHFFGYFNTVETHSE